MPDTILDMVVEIGEKWILATMQMKEYLEHTSTG